MKYKTKVLIIDAIQIPCPTEKFVKFCEETGLKDFLAHETHIDIGPIATGRTFPISALPSDYIIKTGHRFDVMDCKSFESMYEPDTEPAGSGIYSEGVSVDALRE